MTPDENVLVAASRNDHPIIPWRATGSKRRSAPPKPGWLLTLMPTSAAGHQPEDLFSWHPEDAVAFVDALLASPGVQLASLAPEWSKLRQLCLDKQLGGNEMPDAWLSAAVAHMGEHLVSFDRGFRKLLARRQFTLLASA